MAMLTKQWGLTICLGATLFTGCATTTLIEKDTGKTTSTRTVRTVLINDTVMAFGKPAQSAVGVPANSIVIVGQQNSYVLTQGGARFAKLISTLNPKNIQINRELSFYSAKNDGHFSGTLPLTYLKLKDEIDKTDLNFFIENGAEECSTSSDTRMNAQRFCFDLKLAGVVYPAVNNAQNLQHNFTALSKPYQVSIYTNKEETYTRSSGGTNPLEKLVLLPFAVAFDVITLPFQAAERIFD